jgi:hypothetical protein
LFRDEPSGLNFSYSKFNESDLEYLHSKLQESPEEVLGTGKERFDGAISDSYSMFINYLIRSFKKDIVLLQPDIISEVGR